MGTGIALNSLNDFLLPGQLIGQKGDKRLTKFCDELLFSLRPLMQVETKKTILICEPVESLSIELADFFSKKGHEMIQAKTLKETLLILQSQRIDVLVLDAQLLEDDCAFISIIKGIEEGLPIIVCSETNTPELERKIRQKRIFYYHIKSFGSGDLEMAITNALNRSYK